MSIPREKIYLSALLHDIDRFYGRTDKGSSSKKVSCSLLSDDDEKVWTIVEEAACLSAGLSVSEHCEHEKMDEIDCLVPIVEIVLLRDEDWKKEEWWSVPVRPMSLTKEFFPKQKCDSVDYTSLWKGFVDEFRYIQTDSCLAFSETLLNLLFKYAACVPSGIPDAGDVSLYDYSKMTAALSVCLYDVADSGENPESPFLLVGGDFSGIQNYIYQIVSKYASKNLKGRSFYLRLLSDAVVRFLLKKLNLFRANVVYNSGGCFYLVAPNTKHARETLSLAICEIEEKLFLAHRTVLFVALDYIELSRETLERRNGSEDLGSLWGRLFEKRDRKKSCKFAALIKKDYNRFFCDSGLLQGGEAKRDIVSGEEFFDGEKTFEEKDLKPLKKVTKEQIVLGRTLRDAEVMVVSEEPIEGWADKNPINPCDLGFYYYFLKHSELDSQDFSNQITVITLNGNKGDCDFMKKVDGIKNNIYGLDFYGGNEFEGFTFEDMCNLDNDKEDSLKRLGVLRMDVDNLGKIFQCGILPQNATLARYAALSRSLDYFFSGYLNTVWRETDPKHSFIIYSGGDDVFIVGNWTVVIALAERIHEDFKEFTCGNPAFSISGGIAVVLPKYPIMKSAYESGGEESKAKRHTCGKYEKNAIAFMGIPLNWDKEFPAVSELKKKIVKLISEGMPKSFISKILVHAANAGFINHRITEVKTYWRLVYDLSRLGQRMDGGGMKGLIECCKLEVCGGKNNCLGGNLIITDYHPLELWALACRWAELELRT